jgi:hypothetical protein
MNSFAYRLLWTGLCIVIILGIIFDICRLPAERSRIHAIPFTGLGFAGVDIPLTSSELSIYRKAEVIKRYYRFGSDEFVLIAIDGAGNRHAVHDPMYCFRGAGWQIRNKTLVPIQGGEALLLQLEKDNMIRETAYWFSNGRQRHTSVMRYWLQATLRRITLGRSDKEPVLIMLQSVEDHALNLSEVLDQFGVLFDI